MRLHRQVGPGMGADRDNQPGRLAGRESDVGGPVNQVRQLLVAACTKLHHAHVLDDLTPGGRDSIPADAQLGPYRIAPRSRAGRNPQRNVSPLVLAATQRERQLRRCGRPTLRT